MRAKSGYERTHSSDDIGVTRRTARRVIDRALIAGGQETLEEAIHISLYEYQRMLRNGVVLEHMDPALSQLQDVARALADASSNGPGVLRGAAERIEDYCEVSDDNDIKAHCHMVAARLYADAGDKAKEQASWGLAAREYEKYAWYFNEQGEYDEAVVYFDKARNLRAAHGLLTPTAQVTDGNARFKTCLGAHRFWDASVAALDAYEVFQAHPDIKLPPKTKTYLQPGAAGMASLHDSRALCYRTAKRGEKGDALMGMAALYAGTGHRAEAEALVDEAVAWAGKDQARCQQVAQRLEATAERSSRLGAAGGVEQNVMAAVWHERAASLYTAIGLQAEAQRARRDAQECRAAVPGSAAPAELERQAAEHLKTAAARQFENKFEQAAVSYQNAADVLESLASAGGGTDALARAAQACLAAVIGCCHLSSRMRRYEHIEALFTRMRTLLDRMPEEDRRRLATSFGRDLKWASDVLHEGDFLVTSAICLEQAGNLSELAGSPNKSIFSDAVRAYVHAADDNRYEADRVSILRRALELAREKTGDVWTVCTRLARTYEEAEDFKGAMEVLADGFELHEVQGKHLRPILDTAVAGMKTYRPMLVGRARADIDIDNGKAVLHALCGDVSVILALHGPGVAHKTVENAVASANWLEKTGERLARMAPTHGFAAAAAQACHAAAESVRSRAVALQPSVVPDASKPVQVQVQVPERQGGEVAQIQRWNEAARACIKREDVDGLRVLYRNVRDTLKAVPREEDRIRMSEKVAMDLQKMLSSLGNAPASLGAIKSACSELQFEILALMVPAPQRRPDVDEHGKVSGGLAVDPAPSASRQQAQERAQIQRWNDAARGCIERGDVVAFRGLYRTVRQTLEAVRGEEDRIRMSGRVATDLLEMLWSLEDAPASLGAMKRACSELHLEMCELALPASQRRPDVVERGQASSGPASQLSDSAVDELQQFRDTEERRSWGVAARECIENGDRDGLRRLYEGVHRTLADVPNSERRARMADWAVNDLQYMISRLESDLPSIEMEILCCDLQLGLLQFTSDRETQMWGALVRLNRAGAAGKLTLYQRESTPQQP
jgi:tetratricopeptide (TPR) repeat protein